MKQRQKSSLPLLDNSSGSFSSKMKSTPKFDKFVEKVIEYEEGFFKDGIRYYYKRHDEEDFICYCGDESCTLGPFIRRKRTPRLVKVTK